MNILITGVAGFIGFGIARKLIAEGHKIIGVDSLNPFYPVKLKQDRLMSVIDDPNFIFLWDDVANTNHVLDIFAEHKPDYVIHLAGLTDARHSMAYPFEHIQTNMVGFGNILEACRKNEVKHLLFSSSYSVYGAIYENEEKTLHEVKNFFKEPSSLFSAIKQSNELMAYSYAHLYNLPITALRFFSVYGAWDKPTTAAHIFTSAILEDTPITIFNEGKMQRDFIYIEDAIEIVLRLVPKIPQSNSPTPSYSMYDIGRGKSTELMDFIGTLEKILNKEAKKIFLPMQKGEVQTSLANPSKLEKEIDYKANINLEAGLQRFVDWYSLYYKFM